MDAVFCVRVREGAICEVNAVIEFTEKCECPAGFCLMKDGPTVTPNVNCDNENVPIAGCQKWLEVCPHTCTGKTKGLDMPQCTENCVGHSTGHDMSKCVKNCNCMGGSCDMSSCKSGCSCPITGLSRCGKVQAGLVTAVVAGVLVLVGSAVGIFLCCRKRRAAKKQDAEEYKEVAQPVKQEGDA